MTIFVQIASYRDPELEKTIKDMIEMADRPDKLRFGIARQYSETDGFDKLEEYRDEIYGITTTFWHEIKRRHIELLGKSKLIANYEIFEPAWEFRSLGGCFYHVTLDDGPIKIVLPDENLIETFCSLETDCVQYGQDGECVVKHECMDDSLEDMRATLTLLQ